MKQSRQPISIGRFVRCLIDFPMTVHRDQSGSISIASVFSFIFLTILLGMVINLGRHTDRKVKLQNGADAVTFAGSSIMARSMNTLAFTNNLLCDVFALTAYLREARDRNAEALVPSVLQAWTDVSPDFSGAPESQISKLSTGTKRKVLKEQMMVEVFGQHNAAISEQLLPVMEQILDEEMIPEFQRALVDATPGLANQAAYEIATRHGPSSRGLNRGTEMAGLMWRTDGQPFEFATANGLPQLPVSDPVYDSTRYQDDYFRDSVDQRRRLSFYFLGSLNDSMLEKFDASRRHPGDSTFGVAKMSQFGNLWRGFTRGYLQELLEEYPHSNLLFQLRKDSLEFSNTNQYLENDYMYVGVAYWKAMTEHMPGLFRNPLDADSVAFAQAQLFIPQRRIYQDLFPPPRWDSEQQKWVVIHFLRSGGPHHRDLINQNWTVRLVPAVAEAIPTILQSDPPGMQFETPSLGGITVEEFRQINSH